MSLFTRRTERHIAAYQRELIETHFREVDTMYREMRGWRHDWKSQLQTLKALAGTGDMEAVRDYLAKIEADLVRIEPAVRTGNRMADAILNSKISLARSRGIAVRADAHIPVELSMSETDLCVILGNLFDNAIEASLSLPEGERSIRLYMDMKNTQLYISVTNLTAAKKQTKVGNIFRSTKGEGRGYGLARMDAVVKKYDGYLSRACEDGAYTTEILIPQV